MTEQRPHRYSAELDQTILAHAESGGEVFIDNAPADAGQVKAALAPQGVTKKKTKRPKKTKATKVKAQKVTQGKTSRKTKGKAERATVPAQASKPMAKATKAKTVKAEAAKTKAAKAEKRESQLSRIVTPPTEAALKSELEDCIARTRAAYTAAQQSMFQLGDALAALRRAYYRVHQRDLTLHDLKDLLKLSVTTQRLGQIESTANYFPPAYRDEAIDFKAWEVARAGNERLKEGKLPVDALATLVKEYGDSNAVRDALKYQRPPAPKRRKPDFEMTVHRTSGELSYEYQMRWAGETKVATDDEGHVQVNATFYGIREALRAILTEAIVAAQCTANRKQAAGEIPEGDEGEAAWIQTKQETIRAIGKRLGSAIVDIDARSSRGHYRGHLPVGVVDIELMLQSFREGVTAGPSPEEAET